MKILFVPSGKYCISDKKITILEAARKAGVVLNTDCGGKGICGKCIVTVNNRRVKACEAYAEEDTAAEVYEYCADKKISKLPGGFRPRISEKYRIAFDIGTTTVAGILWKGAKNISSLSVLNTQILYGADVISRINFCMLDEKNVYVLQKNITDCINSIISSFVSENNIGEISEMLAVGNTVMTHILLGENPCGLSQYPFRPNYEGMRNVSAKALGIDCGCNLFVLPNIASYVGSDITADIIACGIKKLKGRIILADIGTNGEIVFSDNGRISICSAAAGGAFEGMGIKFGMRACTGAIEEININGNDIEVKTVGNAEPKGICGSGIIDITAKLREKGIIDSSGRILDRNEVGGLLSRRIIKTPKGNNFIIAYGNEDIIVTQNDIRMFQLAKAAICAGIKTLVHESGYGIGDLDNIIVAGSFGSHINIKSALTTGLLPDIGIEKISTAGNCAGLGASMALLSEDIRNQCCEIVSEIRHTELSASEYFKEEYIKCMDIAETHNKYYADNSL